MPDDARRAPKTSSIEDDLIAAQTSHRTDDSAPAIPRVLDIFYSLISFKHPHKASEMIRVGLLIQSARLYKPREVTAAKERKSFNAGQTKGPSVCVPDSKQRRTQTTGEPSTASLPGGLFNVVGLRFANVTGRNVHWRQMPGANKGDHGGECKKGKKKAHTHRTFVSASHDATVRKTGAGANVAAKQQAPAVSAATEPPPHCAMWTQAYGEASTTRNYILSSLVRIR